MYDDGLNLFFLVHTSFGDLDLSLGHDDTRREQLELSARGKKINKISYCVDGFHFDVGCVLCVQDVLLCFVLCFPEMLCHTHKGCVFDVFCVYRMYCCALCCVPLKCCVTLTKDAYLMLVVLCVCRMCHQALCCVPQKTCVTQDVYLMHRYVSFIIVVHSIFGNESLLCFEPVLCIYVYIYTCIYL